MVYGHGLPKALYQSAMPDPYTPCLTAVSGVARPQGGRPATIFYPFGQPTPYAYVHAYKQSKNLYGTCVDFPSTSDEITFPRVERLKLIFVASLSLCPVAPVFDCLSDPARSTRFNLPILTCWTPSAPFSLHSIVTVKMAWDLAKE
jgi:hypothetical protein